jgi:hypothetical protein
MPPALDTVHFTVTAAAVAPGGSPMVAIAGDSLTLRSAAGAIQLLNMWCDTDALGFVQVTSPKLTDATRGLRFRLGVHDPSPLLPYQSLQGLYPVDVLAPTLASVAGAGKMDNLALLIYYADLPGSAARFIDVPTLSKRAAEIMTVESALAPAVGNTYSGLVALNAASDLGKAGADYALVGYKCESAGTATSITWRGADSGNYRVGGPAVMNNSQYTAKWFYDLADYNSIPLIPVFNYNNKAGVFIECVSNDLLAAVTVTSIFVRLA